MKKLFTGLVVGALLAYSGAVYVAKQASAKLELATCEKLTSLFVNNPFQTSSCAKEDGLLLMVVTNPAGTFKYSTEDGRRVDAAAPAATEGTDK